MTEVAMGAEWSLSQRVRTALSYLAAALAVTGVWAMTIWTSTHIHADEGLKTAALFAHLAALTVGMGAVLTLDWLSLRWLFGKLTQREVVRLAGNSHMLIWGGLAGLCISGAFLAPNPHSLMTQVKLGAVLIVALNGILAHSLQHRLDAEPMTTRTLALAGAVATVSQAGWWTAMVVGFINHG